MLKNKKLLGLILFSSFLVGSFNVHAGVSKGKQRKNDRKIGVGGGTDNGCQVIEKSTKILIYNSNFSLPSTRKTEYQPVPLALPSPWGGTASANSLYDSPNSKYYCLVTVAADCSKWGEGGVKTYIWNSKSNEMNINVPENYPFKITVEYYEPCGPYWYGANPYGRGKWYYEQTIGYTPTIAFTQFIFVNKESC